MKGGGGGGGKRESVRRERKVENYDPMHIHVYIYICRISNSDI